MNFNDRSVRPFYIKYEDWMTHTEVCEVFDKAVKAGADLHERVAGCHPRDNQHSYDCDEFEYFGVNQYNQTFFHDDLSLFGKEAVHITLNQINEHLGIGKLSPEQNIPLRNVKIDLRRPDGSVDEDKSRAFQEAVFESGGSWGSGGTEVKHLNVPYLVVYGGGDMYTMCISLTTPIHFKNHENTEITFEYERSLTWKATPKENVRETIEINGVKYFKDDVEECLASLERAE